METTIVGHIGSLPPHAKLVMPLNVFKVKGVRWKCPRVLGLRV